MGRRRRSLWWIAASAVVMLSSPAATETAFADPAGPTDYLSAVVAIEPPTPSVDARIVGGDSFFELDVDLGTEVFVLGYEGERYLWFREDGTVFENQRSPATYLNDDRYGGGETPADLTVGAEPDWAQVASDGSWIWHDHRAHWMAESAPVGFERGDLIIDSTISLVVDGTTVDVRVVSTWQPEPSPWPVWLGALGGVALVAGAWMLRRRHGPAIAALLPASVVALVVGAWQYGSLPSATGPRLVWVALPAIAVACAVIGATLGRRTSRFVSDAAVLVVGIELAVWGFVKRDGLWAAIIPTDAPMWLDRFSAAMGIVGGAAVACCALWWLFAGPGQRAQGALGLAAPGPPVSTS